MPQRMVVPRLKTTLTTREPRQTQSRASITARRPPPPGAGQRPHRAVAAAAGAHLRVVCRGRCPQSCASKDGVASCGSTCGLGPWGPQLWSASRHVGSRACGQAGFLVRNCSVSTEKMVPLAGFAACPLLHPSPKQACLRAPRSPWSPPPTTSNVAGKEMGLSVKSDKMIFQLK